MAKEISLSLMQMTTCARGGETRLLFGLPLRTALAYALLFTVAFYAYSILWKNAPIRASDSASYLGAAQDLSDLHIDHLQERAPGYPLLLVLTGSSQSPNRTLFFVSLLLHFLSIWLLAGVLYSSGLSEKLLNLFVLILLLPPYVEPAAYVLSENLTEVMLVTGFVTFVSWLVNRRTIWIIISAVTIGYAALTRPTYQLLAVAMAGYLIAAKYLFHSTLPDWKTVIKASLILVCGSVVMVGGYAIVNFRSVGYFGNTSKLGLMLSTKTWRFIERLPDEHAAIREALVRARNSRLVTDNSHMGYDYIWDSIPELVTVTGLKNPELSDYMLRINLLLIQKAPLQYLEEVFWALTSFWFPSSGNLANLDSRSIQFVLAVIHFCLVGAFAFNLVLLGGAATYIVMCRRLAEFSNRLSVSEVRLLDLQVLIYGLAATIVVYTAAVSCLVEIGTPRYRVPTDGLIIALLFLGSHLWLHLIGLSRIVISNSNRDLA